MAKGNTENKKCN